MHRLRDLREEVSVRCVDDHQPAEGFGKGDDASIRAEYVQAAQIADAARGTGVGFGGHEWDREVDGAEDFGG